MFVPISQRLFLAAACFWWEFQNPFIFLALLNLSHYNIQTCQVEYYVNTPLDLEAKFPQKKHFKTQGSRLYDFVLIWL